VCSSSPAVSRPAKTASTKSSPSASNTYTALARSQAAYFTRFSTTQRIPFESSSLNNGPMSTR
jgi:hypothetical protein